MAGAGEMSAGHQGHKEVAGGQVLTELFCGVASGRGHRKTEGIGCTRYNREVRATAWGTIAGLIGKLSHTGRICHLAGQGRHHHGHSGRTTAVAFDLVGPKGLTGPGLFSLIKIDNLYRAACEDLLAIPGGKFGNFGVLDDASSCDSRITSQLADWGL